MNTMTPPQVNIINEKPEPDIQWGLYPDLWVVMQM